MNPNSTEFFHMIWLKLTEVWHQVDYTIEMYVQQAIDEIEEIHQQK